mgnify:FL=1
MFIQKGGEINSCIKNPMCPNLPDPIPTTSKPFNTAKEFDKHEYQHDFLLGNATPAIPTVFPHVQITTEDMQPHGSLQKQSVQVLSDTESNMDRELEVELTFLNDSKTHKTDCSLVGVNKIKPPKNLIDLELSTLAKLGTFPPIEGDTSSKDGSSTSASSKHGSSSESTRSAVSLLSAKDLENIKKNKKK